jgi:hypothetical protein
MAELLEQSSRGQDAVDEAQDGAAQTGAPPGDLPDDPSAHPTDDPAWIDRTIEAVLAGAFSADSESEATELPAVDLLLLRSGDTWIGMPWDRVTRLGLSDDTQPALLCAPLSLREVLGLRGMGDSREDTAEPYCLTWETTGGPRSLCCEVLGGVLAAPAAAAREVDLVWLPDDSETGGRLLPLVEFFASSGRDGREEVEAPNHCLDDTVCARGPSPAMPDSAVAESPPAPALPPSATEVAHDPGSDPRAVPPAGGAAPVGAALPRAIRAASPQEAGSTRRSEAEHGGLPGGARHLSRPLGGARSAVVSVRYLPARVAIARALRSHGWFVLEAADTEELPAMLQRVHHTVVFIEAPERAEPWWSKELVRAQEDGARVIGVASRLRGTAGEPWRGLGAIPHLLYPFQEAELERLIESPVQPERG